MDVNKLKIVAVIQYSPIPNNMGDWVMDIRFEEGESKTEESWAGSSYSYLVSVLVHLISKHQPPFVESFVL